MRHCGSGRRYVHVPHSLAVPHSHGRRLAAAQQIREDAEKGARVQEISHDDLLHTYFGCRTWKKNPKNVSQENPNYDILLSVAKMQEKD